MIDWQILAARLADLARSRAPCRLLSVTLPLPHWPLAGLPEGGDWCFWQRPDHGLRMLGFGRALSMVSAGAGRFAALHAFQHGLGEAWRTTGDAGPLPAAFTGFAFAPHGGSPLPNAGLWVSELLLREEGRACWATFSCAANQVDEAVARWRALWQATQVRSEAHGATGYAVLPDPLGEQAFVSRGRAALRAIAAREVDKLVLTRKLRLRAEAPFSAPAVLKALAALHPTCATFGIARRGAVFLGASPETLLSLRGELASVDALAGTAWGAASLPLGADKNRVEHDFVARHVVAQLAECCNDLAMPPAPETMRLNGLVHLHRRITARRAPDISAFDLVARLHPTPAVGGSATAAALDWLERHGEQRGAWYTGGIGWTDMAGDCDVAVALRCGLFKGEEATLYAGSGFVAASDPEQELAETEAKFSAMRNALDAAGREAEERVAA
ncbi:MAG: isochorismate synthase [Ignavibacteria bacterium]